MWSCPQTETVSTVGAGNNISDALVASLAIYLITVSYYDSRR